LSWANQIWANQTWFEHAGFRRHRKEHVCQPVGIADARLRGRAGRPASWLDRESMIFRKAADFLDKIICKNKEIETMSDSIEAIAIEKSKVCAFNRNFG
jgi:hypothetical protein